MKKYIPLHLINFYLIPTAQYALTLRRHPDCDTGDLGLGLLLGTIPLGCFLISLLYGLHPQKSFILHSALCPLLALPISLLDILAGPTLLNHLHGAYILYTSYFTISLLGGLTGRLLNLAHTTLTSRKTPPPNPSPAPPTPPPQKKKIIRSPSPNP